MISYFRGDSECIRNQNSIVWRRNISVAGSDFHSSEVSGYSFISFIIKVVTLITFTGFKLFVYLNLKLNCFLFWNSSFLNKTSSYIIFIDQFHDADTRLSCISHFPVASLPQHFLPHFSAPTNSKLMFARHSLGFLAFISRFPPVRG